MTSETERRPDALATKLVGKATPPESARLPAEEQKQLLAKMTKEIARSPVLSGFGVQVRLLRGRFYVERPTPSGVEIWGRITPLADELLLEVERRSWNEVARGSARSSSR